MVQPLMSTQELAYITLFGGQEWFAVCTTKFKETIKKNCKLRPRSRWATIGPKVCFAPHILYIYIPMIHLNLFFWYVNYPRYSSIINYHIIHLLLNHHHIILYSKKFKMINLTHMMSILNSFHSCILRDEMEKTRYHLHKFLRIFKTT
jgi:hypothetical protein